jgi:hypothetical protein
MSAVIAQHELPGMPVALATPMRMLEIAVQNNADIDKLKQLMDLAERWEKNEARKAFVEAMTQFKADPPTILKTKHVNIPGGAKFAHATLADVVDGVCASLSKYGLSHNWITEQTERGVSVTCVLTHRMGHSERTTLAAPPDDSGKKNGIQQIASTVTYLERYTLMAACGLAAKDMDTDGNKPPQKASEPAGYEKWSMDMEAKAEEGSEALKAAWQASPEGFRNYAVRNDADWWTRVKNKASKVAS